MNYEEMKSKNIADRIYYEIVSHCNLQCIHCSDMQSAISYTEINPEELFQFHEELVSEVEINSVVITGGEPVLHNQFYSIVEFFLIKGVSVLVTTNGLLLDRNKIEELLERYPNLRIQISVDGVTKEVYESIRGLNTWEKLQEVLRYLSNKDISKQVGLSMTILKQNMHQVIDIIDFAEKLGFGFVHFPVLLCIGAAKRRWKEIAPKMEEQLAIERKLFSFIANYSGELYISSNRLEQILTTISSKGYSHCGNSSTLKVSSDGSIYPCPAGISKSIGNIVGISIVDLLRNISLNCSYNEPITRNQCECCEVYDLCASRFCANCNALMPISNEAFGYTCQIIKAHLLDALSEISVGS